MYARPDTLSGEAHTAAVTAAKRGRLSSAVPSGRRTGPGTAGVAEAAALPGGLAVDDADALVGSGVARPVQPATVRAAPARVTARSDLRPVDTRRLARGS